MNRISAINLDEKNLKLLQALVVRAIEWAIKKILVAQDVSVDMVSQMVTVGNPTMMQDSPGRP